MPMQPWTLPANRMKDGNLWRGGMHHRLAKTNVGTETRRIMFTLWAIAIFSALPALAKAQALADSEDSSATIANTIPARPDLTYVRPTGATKLHNYVFDAFGPYPIAGAAFAGVVCATTEPAISTQPQSTANHREASFTIVTVIGSPDNSYLDLIRRSL